MTTEDDVDEFVKEGSSFRQRRAKRRHAAFRGRRAQERQTWEQWKQEGEPEELTEQLLTSLDPIISREATRRHAGLGGRIGKQDLKEQLRALALHGLRTYDPAHKSKAQLSTHVHNQFKAVTDFVAQRRNTAHVPRPKLERKAELDNAINAFKDQFGREPSDHELAGMLPKWGVKLIGELRYSLRPEVYSGMGTPLGGDTYDVDAARAAYLMVRMTMTTTEKQFAERFFPPEGQRQQSVEQIAKAMNIPVHKAYRLKSAVEKKLKPVYRGR